MRLSALLLAAAATAAPGSDPGPRYERSKVTEPVRVPVFQGCWRGIIRDDGGDVPFTITFLGGEYRVEPAGQAAGYTSGRLLAYPDGTARMVTRGGEHLAIFAWDGRRVRVAVGRFRCPRPSSFASGPDRDVWVIEKFKDD